MPHFLLFLSPLVILATMYYLFVAYTSIKEEENVHSLHTLLDSAVTSQRWAHLALVVQATDQLVSVCSVVVGLVRHTAVVCRQSERTVPMPLELYYLASVCPQLYPVLLTSVGR